MVYKLIDFVQFGLPGTFSHLFYTNFWGAYVQHKQGTESFFLDEKKSGKI